MSDDIVSQLLTVCVETADEIKRLEIELERWRTTADRLYVIVERIPPVADHIEVGSGLYELILNNYIVLCRGRSDE